MGNTYNTLFIIVQAFFLISTSHEITFHSKQHFLDKGLEQIIEFLLLTGVSLCSKWVFFFNTTSNKYNSTLR